MRIVMFQILLIKKPTNLKYVFRRARYLSIYLVGHVIVNIINHFPCQSTIFKMLLTLQLSTIDICKNYLKINIMLLGYLIFHKYDFDFHFKNLVLNFQSLFLKSQRKINYKRLILTIILCKSNNINKINKIPL